MSPATSPTPNPQEIGGVLGRINRLGAATEAVFTRLYRGLGRKSRLQKAVDRVRTLEEQRRQLHRMVQKRDHEVERLNGILGTISEGVIMQDTQGRIVMVNSAARELLGNQKNFWESELGTLFNQYRQIETLDSELAPLGNALSLQVNHRILGAQLAAVADSKGARMGTMIVLRDITRETLSERLKDQFVTAISHELRTPMAVIKGMSEVMLGQPSDAKPNRKLLETLSRNVDVLDRMIVELLDISELSGGQFSIRRDSVNLESMLWNVVHGMNPEIKRARLDISVMVANASSLDLHGDDQRLRWALGHLLQNSIRYTEPGGRITLMARRSGDQTAIQLMDTGVGIQEKDLPHIFERFYRGEPRTPQGKLLDPRGLGQGLFIARAVAEAHGGYLTVNSNPGEGSIFTLVLPAA